MTDTPDTQPQADDGQPDLMEQADLLRRRTAELAARADELDAYARQIVAEDEEHRQQLADVLGCPPDTGWSDLTDTAAANLQALTAARAGDGPWITAYREEIEEAERRAREARQLAENMQGRAEAMERRATAYAEAWETATGKLARVREIASRLAAHAAGFQDVLDEGDRGAWGRTVGADITALLSALGDPQPAAGPKSPGIFAGVQGRCPACGRTGLILGSGGYVTCSHLGCPEPDAATTLLERDALVREQPAEPDVDAVRAAVAEAVMCGDGPCITRCHLPRIERLLGGAGLLGGPAKAQQPTT